MSEREDSLGSGLEHLQTAALELIAAARSFLDVAEELVREPAAVATLAKAATAVVAAAAATARPPEPAGEPLRRVPVS